MVPEHAMGSRLSDLRALSLGSWGGRGGTVLELDQDHTRKFWNETRV